MGLGLAASSAGPTWADEGTDRAKAIPLFNGKDLSGWTIFIPHKDKSDPRTDPKGVFRVEDGVIHVSGEEFGCLTTEDEFENYRLLVEFKWGEKKWPPREKAVRDSGILHALRRARQGLDQVDRVPDPGARLRRLLAWWTARRSSSTGSWRSAYKKKTKDAEKPNGEWNTIEVVCDGDKITNIVNGVVVNEGTMASVTKGRIVLQSEGAEVYYRKVELTPLTK